MSRILVTGSSGLLGREILLEGRKKHTICPTHATNQRFRNSLKMDITNRNEVRRTFAKIEPDVVIHTAAVTNVDACEINKKYALKVNSEGTRIVAEEGSQIGARIVYISTDYVFDGEKGLYTEDDVPTPINFYGLTKLMGERHVAKLCDSHAILRTSVLYGIHPERSNFATWVINALKEGKPLSVVIDHFNSPTFADNLAQATLNVACKELNGIYHVAGTERTSRHEFALRIAEAFNLNPNLITATEMSKLKTWVAQRPKDSSLKVDKASKEIDTSLMGISQGLRELKEKWSKRR